MSIGNFPAPYLSYTIWSQPRLLYNTYWLSWTLPKLKTSLWLVPSKEWPNSTHRASSQIVSDDLHLEFLTLSTRCSQRKLHRGYCPQQIHPSLIYCRVSIEILLLVAARFWRCVLCGYAMHSWACHPIFGPDAWYMDGVYSSKVQSTMMWNRMTVGISTRGLLPKAQKLPITGKFVWKSKRIAAPARLIPMLCIDFRAKKLILFVYMGVWW